MAAVFAAVLALILGGLLLLWLLHLSSGWSRTSKSGACLPRGSMGWPILGESLAFGVDPVYYYRSRTRRYGKIFKSCLFGKPAVVGTTSEFAKFVTSNNLIFETGYPANVTAVLGPKAFLFQDGDVHLSLKKLFQKSFAPESLKNQIGNLDIIILRNLASWADRGTVVSIEETRKVTLDVAMHLILGISDITRTTEGKEIGESFVCLSKSFFSPPINLPGTTYNKGLKAKASLTVYLKRLIERRKSEGNLEMDVLGSVVVAQHHPQVRVEIKDLDDDAIVDNIVALLFGSYDTTSTTLCWVLKILLENPNVYQQIQVEMDEIRKARDFTKEPHLTWEDLKKMVYSTKFYWELLRHVPISVGMFRKARKDVEFNGLLIPKDWTVVVMVNPLHSDPQHFPDPSKFDPSRFDVSPKSFTYMPFSSGVHMCPGVEVSKVIALIFIYHITTTFKYESIDADKGIVYASFAQPKGGYPINIRPRELDSRL